MFFFLPCGSCGPISFWEVVTRQPGPWFEQSCHGSICWPMFPVSCTQELYPRPIINPASFGTQAPRTPHPNSACCRVVTVYSVEELNENVRLPHLATFKPPIVRLHDIRRPSRRYSRADVSTCPYFLPYYFLTYYRFLAYIGPMVPQRYPKVVKMRRRQQQILVKMGL
jgi:hypothetical protein